jgi:hypothetical protein
MPCLLPTSAPPYNPQQPSAYLAWWQRHLENGQHQAANGSWVYVLGHAFMQATQLHQPAVQQRFGLQHVWFARYFARQAALPTLQGEHRTMPTSQLRLKLSLLPQQQPTPQWQAAFTTYLLEQLNLSPAEVDEVKLEVLPAQEACCHSPCFGCMVFELPQALERQGNPLWLQQLQQGLAAALVQE